MPIAGAIIVPHSPIIIPTVGRGQEGEAQATIDAYRAAVESLAYQTNDLLRAMRKASGLDIRTLKTDGGASANNFLMKFQAEISDIIIQRPACIETTALGAAYLAGLATGFWKDKAEIAENWRCGMQFSSAVTEEERAARLRGWERAVRCALAWARDDQR